MLSRIQRCSRTLLTSRLPGFYGTPGATAIGETLALCCRLSTVAKGMKAYAGADGRGRLFRPQMNMQRLRRSAAHLHLADFDPHELEECMKSLLRIDRAWLPEKAGFSLYLRPFMYSSAFTLGVAPPTRTTLAIIMCPVGSYFSSGGNYAHTILPQVLAYQRYFTPQVLYSLPAGDDPEDAILSESGAMNIFFFKEKRDRSGMELVTPPLDTTILPGVTRDSVLALAREWGEFDVAERHLTIRELKDAWEEGRLKEMFGTGTACIIQPVHSLHRDTGQTYEVNFDVHDETTLASRFLKQLTDIHHGRVPHEWSVPFE